jgi:hypothetical protein
MLIINGNALPVICQGRQEKLLKKEEYLLPFSQLTVGDDYMAG